MTAMKFCYLHKLVNLQQSVKTISFLILICKSKLITYICYESSIVLWYSVHDLNFGPWSNDLFQISHNNR